LAKGETENTTFARFSKENSQRKEKLALLQNFLLQYDDPSSSFYQQGITEYEKRRTGYNDWLNQQAEKEKTTFVSRTFSFHFVPPIQWTGTEEERKKSVMEHYFDGASFSDPLITRTADLKEWMNGYVNLYGASATTVALRDSLFTLAVNGPLKSRAGHPRSTGGWWITSTMAMKALASQRHADAANLHRRSSLPDNKTKSHHHPPTGNQKLGTRQCGS
jgi:hypothetical protein